MNVIGKASTHPTSSNIKTTKETLRSGHVNDSNVLTVHITCVPCGDELFLEVVILPLVEVILRHCEGEREVWCAGSWQGLVTLGLLPATSSHSILNTRYMEHTAHNITTLQHTTLYPNKYKIPFNSLILTKMF